MSDAAEVDELAPQPREIEINGVRVPTDGPLVVPFDDEDLDTLTARSARKHRRLAETLMPVGTWRSPAGLELGVQVNVTHELATAVNIHLWAEDGRISAAQVPCGTCRAMEAYRPEEGRSFPCLVPSFSKRKDGEENCVLCKAKKQCCSAGRYVDENAPEPRRAPVRDAAEVSRVRLELSGLGVQAERQLAQISALVDKWVTLINSFANDIHRDPLADEVIKQRNDHILAVSPKFWT